MARQGGVCQQQAQEACKGLRMVPFTCVTLQSFAVSEGCVWGVASV